MTKPIEITIPNLSVRLSEQRRAEGVKWYVPHEGQLPFHESLAKIRAIFGGNRSGKTEAGGAETALTSTQSQRYRPRPLRKDVKILVGSESNEYNRDIIVPKLRKWIPSSHIIKETRIQRGFVDFWNLRDGGVIKFKNYEQEADKWAVDDYDLIWLDEQPPHDIWKECLLRIIDRSGSIVLTMTPVKGMTWVYPEVWEKSGTNKIECFMMDMDLNPYLSKEDKDFVLANLTVEERKIRKEGKFIALHGLVIPQYGEKHYIEPFDIPSDWRKIVTVDPHLAKPTSVLWGCIAGYSYKGFNRGDRFAYRELIKDGITPDIVAAILVANNRERIFARIGDPALNMKDNITGVNPFDEFAVHGFPLIAANKKVESGIYAIRNLLDQMPPALYVFRTCPTLNWQLKHYMFSDVASDESKPYSEKIKKREDHMVDNLRYFVNSGIGPARGGVELMQPTYSETGRITGVGYNA